MSDAERIEQLIRERAQRSKLYQKLDPRRQAIFEKSVGSLVSGVDLHQVKTIGVRVAMELSGAENLLDEMKVSMVSQFEKPASGFSPALRNTARDVLLALADPDPAVTVENMRRRRRAAQLIGGVSAGRQLKTNEVQPPSTGARTLRRRK